MKIKLVLLIDVLEDIRGGAERQVYELLKRLDREKFDVSLFVIHQQNIPQEIRELAGNTQGLGIKRIYDLKGIIEGFKFAGTLRKERADVLMTYHFSSDIWGAAFGRLAKVPAIISNRRDEGFWREKIHILAYRFVNRWVNKVVVVSEAVKKMVMAQEVIPEDKIEVVYNGVDVDRFNKPFSALITEEKVICCVGNLKRVKGQHILIDAAADVIKRIPQAHFILVGDGEAKEELVAKTKSLGIEANVRFLGKRDDVPELLANSDVCVLPSLSEGLSNALLEYMAAGKPIVATAVGGNSEVIKSEVNGILIPPNDSAGLAKQIITLIEDKDLAARLSANAKDSALQNFNIDKQIPAISGLLQKMASPEIRVMHLISSTGFFGAEKVMLTLAGNMSYDGIKPMVVAVNNLYNPHTELINEVKRQRIPAEIVNSKRKFDRQTIEEILGIVRKNKINLIHSHNYKANFLGAFAARRAKIPVVATNHLWTGGDFKLQAYEWLDAFMLRFFVKRVVAVSEGIRRDMVWRGVPAGKIDVILNAVKFNGTTEKADDIRAEFAIPKDALIIAVIARLSPEKGHRYLFQAIKKLVIDDKANIRVLVVGEGPLRQTLEKMATELAIDPFAIFTGYRKDMDGIYQAADIVVQPSRGEGLAITLLEAMHQAKAIIATWVGGTVQVIKDGQTGLLIRPADPQAIYLALKQLALHPELRQELGENAREFVRESCSLEKMLASYEKVYREAVRI